MRILQVNTGDVGGGAEGSVWNLFVRYRSRGHASWLAVGRKRGTDPDVFVVPNDRSRPAWTRGWWRLRDSLAGRGFRSGAVAASAIARIPQARSWMEARLGREDFDWPGTHRLLSLPPAVPDVVHCHNLHGGYFDLRALPRLSTEVPVIVNPRDSWLVTGHCAYTLGCERWQSGCGRCPDLTTYPAVPRDATAYNWRRKQAIYGAGRLYVTVPSTWLARQVLESMLRPVTCKVIPNGIDLDVFKPGDRLAARASLGLNREACIVLYAANGGRASRWRDFAMLEAAVMRAAESTGRPITIVCLGEPTDATIPRGTGVTLLTRPFERDAQRVASYYQAANVFALPAIDEAFGKTVTEAMACGVPVVATAVGGITDQVEDGSTGLLVPKGDTAGMARALERTLSDDALAGSLGEAAAKHAARTFGVERQVDDFLSWYGEVRADWLGWKQVR